MIKGNEMDAISSNGSKTSEDKQTDKEQKERRMVVRGVRGATTVNSDNADEILEATRELLSMLVRVNGIEVEDIASIYLTTTQDLTTTFPAFAARQLGWFDLALLCGHEMSVAGSLDKCIRVLIHWNTTKTQSEIGHVYLREAKALRPDHDTIPPIRPVQMNPMDAAMRILAQNW
jgi:chorismate mutase